MIEIKFTEETKKMIIATVIFINDSFSNIIQSLTNQMREIQKVEVERAQQLEKFAALLALPEPKELQKEFEKIIEEFNRTFIELESKNEQRQTWRNDTYRNKLHSRMVNKKMLYHNCRNNC